MKEATSTPGATPSRQPVDLVIMNQPESEIVSSRATRGMGFYVILLNLILVYLLLKIWPGTVPVGTHDSVQFAWGSWSTVEIWIETRYLLIVALAGALGSYVHLATSFADFVGNRRLAKSWTWWYLLRPFIGTALALVVYLVLRAGLISGASGTAVPGGSGQFLSPYGIAATAALCGLFSKQATDKLKELFEDLFRTKREVDRADPLTGEAGTRNSGAGS